MVVEVTLRSMGAELHGKDSLRHFLRGGLAVASGNRDLLQLEAALICLGELEQRFRSIVYGRIHGKSVLFNGFLIYNAHQRTILFHLVDKLVGVKLHALYRPEHHALGLFS